MIRRLGRASWRDDPSEERVDLLQLGARVMAFVVLVGVGVLGWQLVQPERERQRALNEELAGAEQAVRDQAAMLDHDRLVLELTRRDPDVMETNARDQLDLYREGETIFRLDRSPRVRPPALSSPESSQPN